MRKEIIFALIPKAYWIILLIAIIFASINGVYISLAYFAFNIFLYLTGSKFAILVHEIGHLVFAKMVGGNPRRMILGSKHKVAQFDYRGIIVTINSNFNSGYAVANFDNLKFIRLKILAYSSGGLIVNFLIAFLLLVYGGFSTDFSERVQASTTIGVANLLIGIYALIPRYSTFHGVRMTSDGLSILRVPFLKEAELKEYEMVNGMLNAHDLYESKKYEAALAVYEEILENSKRAKTVLLNLSMTHLKLGKYEKAAELLESMLARIEEEPFSRISILIFNGLGWVYMILNKLQEAEEYAQKAFGADPNSEYVRGTWASVMIETDRYKEGINHLINDVDFKFPNHQTLAAAIYLGLAFHGLNQQSKAKEYWNFVENNLEELDVDGRFLFERAKKKAVELD